MSPAPPQNRLILALLIPALCVGQLACTTNPVNGSRELRLTSQAREVRIGAKYYDQALQQQGGDFSIDLPTSEYVTGVGLQLAAKSERPDLEYEFTVINSSASHAWSLPGGKIGITRGLLSQLESEAELAAVLGHQVAHSVAAHGTKVYERDIAKSVVVTVVAIGATFFGVPLIAAVPLLMRTGSTSEWLTHRKHSDGQEVEADRLAMEYMQQAGYDVRAATDLLSRMAIDPGDAQSTLRESHPISRERLAAAQMLVYRMGSQQAGQGERHTERYQRELSWLIRIQNAYADYDSAYTAFYAGELDAALELARRATARVPEEARFHELEGEVLGAEGRYEDALVSYDTAVALDPDHARAYLGRASMRRALGDHEGAQRDFGTSYILNPNAAARRELGDLMDRRDWAEPDWSDPFERGGYNMSDPRPRTPFHTSPGADWYRHRSE